eukprot:451311-Ditylum_brightwellii.AAC.1
MAVSNNCTLKYADYKNAFCHGVLPEDKEVIICPLAGCPVSKKNIFWKLDCTLYNLCLSPHH